VCVIFEGQGQISKEVIVLKWIEDGYTEPDNVIAVGKPLRFPEYKESVVIELLLGDPVLWL